MSKFRSYVLPAAIIFGFLFHNFCVTASFLVPYIIFTILVLNFVTVDLRHLKFSKLHFLLLTFQILTAALFYFGARRISADETIAQGLMMGALCPVASSVVVVSSMLGADRMTTTSYTMLCNLAMSVFAPLCFTLVGVHPEYSFLTSFLLIFRKIAPIIALPFFIVLVFQIFVPKVNEKLCKYQPLSFYLWALALFLTLGKTISFMITKSVGNGHIILVLGVLSVLVCALQFGFGKWLGGSFGDRISGGQLLGQKNTALGIWMSNVYLEPLSSVFLAFYIIWQNLFNSFQLWLHDRSVR